MKIPENKIPFLLVCSFFYILAATWLSSGLCYVFYGGNFIDAEPWAIYYFWQEVHDLPGKRLKVFFAFIIPYLPPLAIIFSDRWSFEELYGSAKFATTKEIKKAALYATLGIILAKRGNNFLIADGTEHVFLAAPTRSGKGVGFVIPNLLAWDGSCIVLDMKFENYDSTANYRKACGHEVYQFSPGQRNTHCFNPFDLVDKDDPIRIDMLQTIASFIIPTPKNADPMWSAEGRNLLISACLYLLDSDEYLTFNKILHFVQTNSVDDIENTLIADHMEELDPVCRANFRTFLDMGDKQQGGVKTEVTGALTMFHNPLVAYATSKSDFDIRDLKKKKISIYLGATPKTLITFSQLYNLFFQFAIALNTERIPDSKTEPHQILMLLDEFPALGEMELIKKGIGYFAGYGIRLAVIAQGESQIEDIYTNTGLRSFLTNFKYKIYYAPNDPKDAESLSSQLGTKTVKNISDSKPSIVSSGSRSESHSKASRSLMLAQEVRMLSRSKLILLAEAVAPIKAQKIVYFQDQFFKNKFFNVQNKDATPKRVPPPVPAVPIKVRDNSASKTGGADDLGMDNSEPLSDDQMESFVAQYFNENIDIDNYVDDPETPEPAYNPFDQDDSFDETSSLEMNTESYREAPNEVLDDISDPFDDTLENTSLADLLSKKDLGAKLEI
jgi:type IV secretion system protein VirD4